MNYPRRYLTTRNFFIQILQFFYTILRSVKELETLLKKKLIRYHYFFRKKLLVTNFKKCLKVIFKNLLSRYRYRYCY